MSHLASHKVEAILADLDHLGIELVAVPAALVAGTARRYKCSAYDAAYVGLAEQHRVILVTADRCLWESVGPRCERLRWIERSDAKTQA
jgi:predicted nucleic acid-binding protein